MKWNIDKSRPICPQICEQLCVRIASGKFAPNERLLSVREVAIAAGVNPNTVQKSFEQLESQGLVYSVRGSGWYVGENIELASSIVSELHRSKTDAYLTEMAQLGFDTEQTAQYIKEWNQ